MGQASSDEVDVAPAEAPPTEEKPQLRSAERCRVTRGDEELVVLRDPVGLAEPFAVDADFSPVLDLLDGQHSMAQIRQSLRFRGFEVEQPDLESFVASLQAAAWLDDETFRARWREAHDEFCRASIRPAAHAGVVYADDPAELARVLGPPPSLGPRADNGVVGVVCPYQPFEAAPQLYRRLIHTLPDPRGLEAIVVIGTDLGRGRLPLALSNKPYETPLGVVPVAAEVSRALATRCPWIEREQWRHRAALSTEIAAVVLAQAYGRECPGVVPLLCGRTAASDDGESETEAFLAAAEALLGSMRVLWFVVAELSHVGPAFGGGRLTPELLERVHDRDREVIAACSGDVVARRVVKALDRAHEAGPLSSAPTLNVAAQLLPVGCRGELLDLARIPAVGEAPGEVTIATLAFRQRPSAGNGGRHRA
ncbi:MAG: AmmeMemoRadiSam system protein B [Myxococcales bacterium FL481]|nr:MAG: AmmeMemoRadiSam system protein B [Myxococcales bacterium FL481]